MRQSERKNLIIILIAYEKILLSTIDVNPGVVKMVDEEFWELF